MYTLFEYLTPSFYTLLYLILLFIIGKVFYISTGTILQYLLGRVPVPISINFYTHCVNVFQTKLVEFEKTNYIILIAIVIINEIYFFLIQ